MLLLAPDSVTLFAPSSDTDTHNWALAGDQAAWSGVGNLQLTAGISDPRATDNGGRGPFSPATDQAGVLYLPPDAPAADGVVASVRGRTFVLSQVRDVIDPLGGGLDCIAATVVGMGSWPVQPSS